VSIWKPYQVLCCCHCAQLGGIAISLFVESIVLFPKKQKINYNKIKKCGTYMERFDMNHCLGNDNCVHMVMWMGKHYHGFNNLTNCPFELLFWGRGGGKFLI